MGGHPLLEVCSLQESGDLEGRDRNTVGRLASLSDGQEHLSAVHQAFRPGIHVEEDTVRPSLLAPPANRRRHATVFLFGFPYRRAVS
jgi:hypothetical protein